MAMRWVKGGGNTMADDKTAKAKGSEKMYRGLVAAVEVGKLAERAPRFGRLAKAIEGGQTEVSDAQREFLDDFREEVDKGAGGGERTS